MLSLDGRDKSPGTRNLPRLSHKEMSSLSKPVTSKETESVIKRLPVRRNPDPEGFTGEFDGYFRFSHFFNN